MKNKNVILAIILVIVVLVVAMFWFESRKTTPISSSSNQGQTVVNNENVQDTTSVIEKQPKTLNDLLAQAEEIQLPKVDTTGWQTYRDEKLGIEFMYPKGWVVKETVYTRNGDRYLCIKTENNRFARISTSSAQVLQGDECVFDVRESSGLDDIKQLLKNFPDTFLTVLVGQDISQKKILSLRTKDETNIFYFQDATSSSLIKLQVWEMDRRLLDADSVLQNLVQTLKPIQK